MWQKTGCLITADGSDDDQIQPEGLPGYRVKPPLPIDVSTAPPSSNDTEPDDQEDNGDIHQEEDDEPPQQTVELEDNEEDRTAVVGRQIGGPLRERLDCGRDCVSQYKPLRILCQISRWQQWLRHSWRYWGRGTCYKLHIVYMYYKGDHWDRSYKYSRIENNQRSDIAVHKPFKIFHKQVVLFFQSQRPNIPD